MTTKTAPHSSGPSANHSNSQAERKRQRTARSKHRRVHRKWTLYAPLRSTEDPTIPVSVSTFRFMSFNVLADYLVKQNYRKTDTATYRQKYDWMHRRERLLREILHWSPHVVNLQEVDHYEDFFKPRLEKAGFVGVYKRRTGETTHDGCAIFVKKSMFRIVTSHEIEYRVQDHPVLNRDNIALAAVVEIKSDANGSVPARFVVANTHLLFNPNRGEIKLAQLDMLLKYLTSLRQQQQQVLPILLAGDFNIAPHSPLYHFLSSGKLDASVWAILIARCFSDDQKASRVVENGQTRHHGNGTAFGKYNCDRVQRNDFRDFKPNTLYAHELDLASAYAQSPDDRCTGEPKFTIFHSSSKGAVDYMWYTRTSLHCHGVLEMIPAGVLFKNGELPTMEHSSDHLSLALNTIHPISEDVLLILCNEDIPTAPHLVRGRQHNRVAVNVYHALVVVETHERAVSLFAPTKHLGALVGMGSQHDMIALDALATFKNHSLATLYNLGNSSIVANGTIVLFGEQLEKGLNVARANVPPKLLRAISSEETASRASQAHRPSEPSREWPRKPGSNGERTHSSNDPWQPIHAS
ncbi:unnamed protein product [Peronospora farinosa]|uniref:Endonuclease/exonuclease/phosphatase domain-containing protein n=1 Tax=Peronospora farinosa TaxID=134698 RepID=A0AAV0TC08_9STRA|nr:unnamed protein product [Peronospora farinosa]